MKTKAKALVLFLCAVLLVVTTVFVTMAFLTDNDSVKNTFTVGKVDIILDETDVDGSKTNVTTEGRDRENKYKLIPGETYIKDPIIHVQPGSEDSWLFVKLENGLENAVTLNGMTGWTLVEGETDIYAYADKVSAGDNITVFESFTVKTDVDLTSYLGAEINVTAYAIQGTFDSADEAWAQAGGEAQGN